MKNSKRGFVVLVIIFVVMSAAALYVSYSVDKADKVVCFGETCVNVEIASTPQEMTRGLMFRESLGADDGMLFVFSQEGNYSFWMKNTLIPLDMIWINEASEVVYIAHADPCVEDPCVTYNPNAMARYVVEVNQGFAEENGIVVGDLVEMKTAEIN